jgi:uncharacterized membrane protein YebE (DUF533 family)
MPNKVSYLDNLQKELGQWKSAARATKGKAGKKQQPYSDALGQLGGALIGKRYSDKTGKRIK